MSPILPQPNVSAIADTTTTLTEHATTIVSEQLPQLDAVPFPIRPRGSALDWKFYDESTLLVAHDPAWFTAEQAVAVVRLVLGRRINLVQAVTR